MTFALDYRPRRFSDVAGQTASAAVLHQMARRRTVPNALLFAGAHGCGKTSAARILGAALNCEEPPGPASEWPCGRCASCKAVEDDTSLCVTEVDAASNGGVDNIRSIREQALYGGAGEYHLFILDEAHSMSRDAFNALLKVLEEPPPRTVFTLLTTEPGRILPTVVSRCMTFMFSRISVPVIRKRLEYVCQDKNIAAEPALLTGIAERAGGAMRDAMMLLEQAANVGITDLARWQVLVGESDFAPVLLKAAADGDYQCMFAELDKAMAVTGDYAWVISKLISCMRDILVLTSGGHIQCEGTSLETRTAVAARLTPYSAVAAMRVLWDLQTRVRAEDRAQGLQVACTLISDAMKPAADTRSSGQIDCGPVSLEQLQLLVSQP